MTAETFLVAVFGSKTYREIEAVGARMHEMLALRPDACFLIWDGGGAGRVDKEALRWCRLHGLAHVTVQDGYEQHLARIGYALAFDAGTKGTGSAVRNMRKHGIPMAVYPGLAVNPQVSRHKAQRLSLRGVTHGEAAPGNVGLGHATNPHKGGLKKAVNPGTSTLGRPAQGASTGDWWEDKPDE